MQHTNINFKEWLKLQERKKDTVKDIVKLGKKNQIEKYRAFTFNCSKQN